MNPAILLSVTDRFAMSIDGLCRAVAARIAFGLQAALIVLIWTRLRRIGDRVQALAVLISAGKCRLRQAVLRGPVLRSGRGPISRPPCLHLPRGFAWLLGLVPCEAANIASQIRGLLLEPEMVALLAASPQMGRILRPLCRMLGLEAGLLAPAADPAAVVVDTAIVAAKPGHGALACALVGGDMPGDGWADGKGGCAFRG